MSDPAVPDDPKERWRVLDVSAGRRNIWLDRHYPGAVFVDIRPGVKPDVVADSRSLPFATGIFSLVLFDPPHTTFGPNAQMAARFGSYKAADIRNIVLGTGREIARVLRLNGLCAFKWSDHGHMSVEAMVARMPHLEPMFGHVVKQVRTGHVSETRWLMLRRRDDFTAADELWRQYKEAV